eukprot:scaffold256260_cov31-Tisochrysis_lutea.AAC.1
MGARSHARCNSDAGNSAGRSANGACEKAVPASPGEASGSCLVRMSSPLHGAQRSASATYASHSEVELETRSPGNCWLTAASAVAISERVEARKSEGGGAVSKGSSAASLDSSAARLPEPPRAPAAQSSSKSNSAIRCAMASHPLVPCEGKPTHTPAWERERD